MLGNVVHRRDPYSDGTHCTPSDASNSVGRCSQPLLCEAGNKVLLSPPYQAGKFCLHSPHAPRPAGAALFVVGAQAIQRGGVLKRSADAYLTSIGFFSDCFSCVLMRGPLLRYIYTHCRAQLMWGSPQLAGAPRSPHCALQLHQEETYNTRLEHTIPSDSSPTSLRAPRRRAVAHTS